MDYTKFQNSFKKYLIKSDTQHGNHIWNTLKETINVQTDNNFETYFNQFMLDNIIETETLWKEFISRLPPQMADNKWKTIGIKTTFQAFKTFTKSKIESNSDDDDDEEESNSDDEEESNSDDQEENNQHLSTSSSRTTQKKTTTTETTSFQSKRTGITKILKIKKKTLKKSAQEKQAIQDRKAATKRENDDYKKKAEEYVYTEYIQNIYIY